MGRDRLLFQERQGDTCQNHSECDEHNMDKEQTNGGVGTNDMAAGRERIQGKGEAPREDLGRCDRHLAEPLCPVLQKQQSSLC